MELHRVTSEKDGLFKEMFALYEISFPEREQRVLEKQVALLTNPAYHCDAITEDGAFAGILMYWEGTGYAYVEHFAVLPSMRGKNVGSGVMEAFCREHPVAVLEIDPPVDEISVRRKGFYERLGFKANGYAHKHPAYRKQYPPHELVVMSYPEPMTETDYRLFLRELNETVMKDCAVWDIRRQGRRKF